MNDTRRNAPRTIAILLIVTGLAVHVMNAVLDWHGQAWSLSLALLAWASLPYLAGLLMLFVIRQPVIVLVGLVGPLIVDLLVEYRVYIMHPSSTAALDLLFVPLLNIMVVEPVGLLLGWVWFHRRFNQ